MGRNCRVKSRRLCPASRRQASDSAWLRPLRRQPRTSTAAASATASTPASTPICTGPLWIRVLEYCADWNRGQYRDQFPAPTPRRG